MFKNLSLSAKLYFGFGSVLAIATALGVFAYTRLVKIQDSSTIITKDCLPGIISISKINSLAKDNMRWTQAAILADGKDEIAAEKEKIKANVQEVEKQFKAYEASITQDRDRKMFEATREPLADYRKVRGEVIALAEAGKHNEAVYLLKEGLRPTFKKFETSIEDLVQFNVENSAVQGTAITADVNKAKTGIATGLLLAIAVGAGIGIFLSRSISSALTKVINSLTEGSEQVSSASGQVSQSSQQMAEGASEQASSLEETSASLEEMSSMTKQNSDNAKQANIMANDTRQAVEKSRTAMSRMSEAIGQIKESSDQTAKIVKTIDEIAFQTNLLALNAAVEAARAGDAGKGFAVVAEEVRNLAQRSADAAKTTSSLIEQSQKNSDNGVAVSQEVAGILTQIVDSVGKLSQLIGEVSSASQEQAKGIEQIGTAVTEMDKLTQSNAASAEESASASEELSAQAKELNDMVNVLVGIVTGSSQSSRPPLNSRTGAGRQPAVPAARSGKPGKAQAPRFGKPSAKFAQTGRAGQDWSPAPGNGRNGHGKSAFAAAARVRTANPEEVIPLNDDELKDF
ncbi:MAG: methyl-accepting chemotaxis protein [Fibrobacteria bacterium]